MENGEWKVNILSWAAIITNGIHLTGTIEVHASELFPPEDIAISLCLGKISGSSTVR